MPDPLAEDIDLSAHQLRAIGLFNARWGHLETEMNFTISALGQIVETDSGMPNPFNRRYGRWCKLIEAHYSDRNTRKEALQIAGAIDDLHSWRAKFTHGRLFGWKGHRGIILVEVHRHLRDWTGELYQVPAKEFVNGALDATDLHEWLIDFNQAHLPVQPPSLPRRFPAPLPPRPQTHRPNHNGA